MSSDPAQAGSIPVRLRYQGLPSLLASSLLGRACFLAQTLAQSCTIELFRKASILPQANEDEEAKVLVAEASAYAYEPGHPVAAPLGHYTGVGTTEMNAYL